MDWIELRLTGLVRTRIDSCSVVSCCHLILEDVKLHSMLVEISHKQRQRECFRAGQGQWLFLDGSGVFVVPRIIHLVNVKMDDMNLAGMMLILAFQLKRFCGCSRWIWRCCGLRTSSCDMKWGG